MAWENIISLILYGQAHFQSLYRVKGAPKQFII